ncbi:MAG: hypothetical protein WAL59_05735 [Roseiarcus sp.]
MAKEDKALPETMIAPETGALLSRGVRPFTVTYKGESVTVDLPGYYPEGGVTASSSATICGPSTRRCAR